MLQLAKAFTGIDLEKEVDRVTVFLAGDPDGEPQYLFVVQGTFDNQVVEAKLTQTLGKMVSEKTYQGDDRLQRVGVGTLFPGREDHPLRQGAVDSRVDRPADRARRRRCPRRSRRCWSERPATIFSGQPFARRRSSVPGPWPSGIEKNKDLHENLQKLECVSFACSAGDDGLLVNALGYAGATDEAKEVYDYLKSRKSALLTKEGSNVFAASFLILSELNTSGPYVQGSFRLTAKAIEELWKTKVIVKPKSPASGPRPKPVRRATNNEKDSACFSSCFCHFHAKRPLTRTVAYVKVY